MSEERDAVFRRLDAVAGDAAALARALPPAARSLASASEGWPLVIVAYHIGLGLRRQAGFIARALTGERPFIFAWEPTHELNAVMARDHATLSKDEAASAIEEGLARLRAIASRMNEDAWSREVFEYENRRRSADVVLRRIVLPHAAEHLASMRRTLSPETGAR